MTAIHFDNFPNFIKCCCVVQTLVFCRHCYSGNNSLLTDNSVRTSMCHQSYQSSTVDHRDVKSSYTHSIEILVIQKILCV